MVSGIITQAHLTPAEIVSATVPTGDGVTDSHFTIGNVSLEGTVNVFVSPSEKRILKSFDKFIPGEPIVRVTLMNHPYTSKGLGSESNRAIASWLERKRKLQKIGILTLKMTSFLVRLEICLVANITLKYCAKDISSGFRSNFLFKESK
jgi:hypothetical protein